MINEDKQVVITTNEGFEIIRIITKMGMKNTLIEMIAKNMKLDAVKNSETIKIRDEIIKRVGGKDHYNDLSEEEKNYLTQEILSDKSNKISETLLDVNTQLSTLYLDIAFEFVSKIPTAEKEFYKTLAKIFNKEVKEVEKQSIEETMDMLKQIANSSTFKNLLAFFK